MSALTKAKGFKKSRSGTYLSMAATAFGAIGVAKRLKTARAEKDTLVLIDATVSAAAIVTGPDGKALLDAEVLGRGDRVTARLARGRFTAAVLEVLPGAPADPEPDA